MINGDWGKIEYLGYNISFLGNTEVGEERSHKTEIQNPS